MSNIPDDLKYASTHEWISVNEEGLVTVGISDHAQEALGDIVFVELPEAGASVNSKEEVAVVESVKAASDIYSPLTCLLYTSPSPRDRTRSRMPSSA